MNARRPELVMMALSLAGWAVAGAAVPGCGADRQGTPETAAAGGYPQSDEADALDATEGPRFSIDGRGESSKTSAVLEVYEGEGIKLSITGADASDNIIVISVAFANVEGVVGTHTLPIGVLDERVFAVGSVDGQAYQSVSGELELELTADRHAQGRFEVALGRDSFIITAPNAPAAGEPTPATEELTLSGTFESQWTLTCYSRLRGFTGSHLVSDSPYCNGLTFE